MTRYSFPLTHVFPVPALRKEIDRIFDDTFSAPTATGWAPAVDAREDNTSFVFEYDLPGVTPEGLEVLAEDGVLSVRGERQLRDQTEGEKQLVAERAGGKFERSFRLPKTADAGAITAEYANGVLTVRVAKVAPAQPKRVTVTAVGS